MDYSKFGKVEVESIDGVKNTITYDDIFMTDIMSASASLFNTSSGHIALALEDYKSVDDILAVIEASHIDSAYKRTIKKDIQALVGISSIDYSQTANVVAKNLANIAIGKFMVLSTISLGSEGVIALSNMVRSSGVFKAMKAVSGKSIKTLGEDSFAMHSIANGEDGFGYGMHKFGATFGQFRTFDEFGNVESGLEKASRFSEMFRDFTLHTLPFVRSSDYLERLNFQDTLDALKAHFDGKLVFKDYELKAFGLDDKIMKKLQGTLELNSKGHVKFFDYTKWTLKEQTDFKAMVDRMMMKRMNKTTTGTSGAWSRHSAIGVALAPMLSFPMSAYSNIGAFLGRGLLQGDSFSMVQTMLWFQAGMVQSAIRHEIKGQEYDDTDLLYAGFTNMPFSGLYGTAMGLGNAPTTQMMEEITAPLDLYNYVGN